MNAKAEKEIGRPKPKPEPGFVPLKKHSELRAEVVKLKLELARLKGNPRRIELGSRQNNKDPIRSVAIAGEGSQREFFQPSGASCFLHQIEELKGRVATGAVLDLGEISRSLTEIEKNAKATLRQVAVERDNLDGALKLMTLQRDDLVEEAGRLTHELRCQKPTSTRVRRRGSFVKEVVIRHRRNPAGASQTEDCDTKRKKDNQDDSANATNELNQWKFMVEQLGVELNETKRQKEELAANVDSRIAALTQSMDEMNKDMTAIISQKDEEILGLVSYMSVFARRNGADQDLKMRRMQQGANVMRQYQTGESHRQFGNMFGTIKQTDESGLDQKPQSHRKSEMSGALSPDAGRGRSRGSGVLIKKASAA